MYGSELGPSPSDEFTEVIILQRIKLDMFYYISLL
jgi:hypothetical protein